MRPTGPGTLGLAVVLAVTLALSGCTGSRSDTPTPAGMSGPVQTEVPGAVPAADSAVQSLVTGLSTGKLDAVRFTQATSAVLEDYKVVTGGMDALLPRVTAGPIAYSTKDKERAGVRLEQTYTIGGKPWTFASTATLTLNGDTWLVDWAPSIVHPDLTSLGRLRHTRTLSPRATITGANGLALVEDRQVFQIGIDKSQVSAAEAPVAAAALARLVRIDPAGYTARVRAAGPKAFVLAVTVRAGQVPARLDTVKGSRAISATMMLPPNKNFAAAILGTVGTATPEIIKAAKGAIEEGDTVGLTGLQRRYDAQLRGSAGHTVTIVQRTTPSPFGAGTASPGADPDAFVETVLFTLEPVPGTPLATTINLDLQLKAEEVLARQRGVASMVVLSAATGQVLVAANSPASLSNADATFGRYPPGSTFKIATSLALLRKGFTPATPMNCPATVTISGWTYKNYSDYPASKVGKITLAEAVANSCNTAFMLQNSRLGAGDLAAAAASLGVGVDYDAGFPAFYGSVPTPSSVGLKVTSMIGQGQVEASALAMAGLAASVSAGRTTIPWLIQGKRPTSTAQALTPAEAKSLQALMAGVVTNGSGRVLAGLMTGAKTGTAEYGSAKPLKTHAWMIAYNANYAVAVMVKDGASGSSVAAPVIKAFFS